jgi:hypothetical protein
MYSSIACLDVGKSEPSIKIAAYDDFLEELKESEVIEICNTASLIRLS